MCILDIETLYQEEYNFYDILKINEEINFPKNTPICKIKFMYETYPPYIFSLENIKINECNSTFIKRNFYNHKIKIKYNNIFSIIKNKINNLNNFVYIHPIENNNYNIFVHLYDAHSYLKIFKKNIGKIFINLIDNSINNIEYKFDNYSLQLNSNIFFYPYYIIKIDMIYVKLQNNLIYDYLSKSDLFLHININDINKKTSIISNSDKSKWIFNNNEMEFYLLNKPNIIIKLFEEDTFKNNFLGSIDISLDEIINCRETNIINKSINKIADISVKIFYNLY